MSKRPKIGITMGDPKGIGPELIARAWPELSQRFELTLFGDPLIMKRACRLTRRSLAPILKTTQVISNLTETPRALSPHQAGLASIAYIREAVSAAQKKVIHGIVTAPICKEHAHAAGFPFPGHTEYLAHLTRTKKFAMMMAGRSLKVVLVTVHEPLSKVSELLTPQKILTIIQLTHAGLKKYFSLPHPKIGVAGLNPHAGENNAFGREESRIIRPAIRRAQEQHIKVSGPFSADTLFVRAVRGEFDAVVCMYHDQGLIPLKLLHFKDGVNITLGLPLIRTSVDHGTAFDIAWKGRADPASFLAAAEMAGKMIRARRL